MSTPLRPWPLLACILLAPQVWGATFELQDVSMMTWRSSLVVRALPLVETGYCTWDDEHRLIVTRMVCEVREVLKGTSLVSYFELETLGGFLSAEDLGLYIPGSPRYRADEEVVLFLTPAPDGLAYRTLDFAAGKVELIPDGQRTLVSRRDLHADGVLLLGDGAVFPADFDALRAAIRAADFEQAWYWPAAPAGSEPRPDKAAARQAALEKHREDGDCGECQP